MRLSALMSQVRLWDVASPASPLMQTWGHHTEFAVGLDFSLLADGQLASAGWDELVSPRLNLPSIKLALSWITLVPVFQQMIPAPLS